MRPPPLLPFFLYASITTWHRYSPISSQHWYACCMWCQSAVCSLGTSFYPLFLNILICHWFSWKLMLFLFFFQVWVIMYSKNEVFITFHYHFMVVIHLLFFYIQSQAQNFLLYVSEFCISFYCTSFYSTDVSYFFYSQNIIFRKPIHAVWRYGEYVQ